METTPEHANRLLIPHPILTNEELDAISNMDHRGWKSRKIDITYPRSEGADGLAPALNRICQEVEQAIADGYSIAVLSDRNVSGDRIPVSSLLATGAVHHHLVKQAKRTQIGLVLESGEAREVHHHCLLIGYGIDAINPYLAFESLWQARRDNLLNDHIVDDDKVVALYKKAVAKGMLKVMGKMGISTLQSYKGAQIFEAIGLQTKLLIAVLLVQPAEFRALISAYWQQKPFAVTTLDSRNVKKKGYRFLPIRVNFTGEPKESDTLDPVSIANLQVASRTNNRDDYWKFAEHINNEERKRASLRGLLEFKPGANGDAIDLEEVQPASEIVKRFVTGAMSFGSISAESHETLAIAMNRLGEGKVTPEKGEKILNDLTHWKMVTRNDRQLNRSLPVDLV